MSEAVIELNLESCGWGQFNCLLRDMVTKWRSESL